MNMPTTYVCKMYLLGLGAGFCLIMFTVWIPRIGQNKGWSTAEISGLVKKWYKQESPPPCGSICSYIETRKQAGANISVYPQLEKEVNCSNMIYRMAWDKYKPTYPPPRKFPKNLINAFTQNGQLNVKYQYYNSVHIRQGKKEWQKQEIEKLQQSDKQGKIIALYGTNHSVSRSVKKYSTYVKDKEGVVIGTEKPWVEAILLNSGARRVTTLEYNHIKLHHPKLVVMNPVTFARKFLDDEVAPLDFAASYSSIEHSGLGRYGDPINPYGDFEIVAQIWCMMKPGGIFFLGVPMFLSFNGSIKWNAERHYGQARLPHLTANWRLLEVHPDSKRPQVLVLQKPQ